MPSLLVLYSLSEFLIILCVCPVKLHICPTWTQESMFIDSIQCPASFDGWVFYHQSGLVEIFLEHVLILSFTYHEKIADFWSIQSLTHALFHSSTPKTHSTKSTKPTDTLLRPAFLSSLPLLSTYSHKVIIITALSVFLTIPLSNITLNCTSGRKSLSKSKVSSDEAFMTVRFLFDLKFKL